MNFPLPAFPHVLLLSIPGLRLEDLARMPALSALAGGGACVPLAPGLPALTCPVQATLTTGARPSGHGVVANGVFHRTTRHLEMWISPDSVHQATRLWDQLKSARPDLRTAAWFALQSKHATADLVCMPAPKHNPDGSETMWCHTRPEPLYGKLRQTLGDFPLHKFWGPIAGIESSRWIWQSFIEAARDLPPHFAYLYLPHLDYAAQRTGPDSPPAHAACGELDAEIEKMIASYAQIVGRESLIVLVAGEYKIRPVSQTLFPNRVLREAGLLSVIDTPDGEILDQQGSFAWALADHQVSHIYLQKNASQQSVDEVAALFRGRAGVGQVLTGQELVQSQLSTMSPPGEKSLCGDVVVISTLDSWQSYFYWLDDAKAPRFARTIDIHRKPGYDPLELHFDRTTKPTPGGMPGIPLDTSLVKGSHGAIDPLEPYETIFLASHRSVVDGDRLRMDEVAGIVRKVFGV
ncbi:MAG: alkaline phosphatase family protein [Planctomycetota bacterium]|nr:MAG: alkaline phosphatase family protein [Planctomycetota bacterium]